MAEYLAPGVYVEETSFRAKSIEGVGTSTTAFVGPTRRGPVGGTPEILTSESDFERVYGGFADLGFASATPNYVALAVRAFFENGGGRLYVARTGTGGVVASNELEDAPKIVLTARAPGAAGNGTVRFTETSAAVSGDAIAKLPTGTLVKGAADAIFLKLANGSWVDSAAAAASAPTSGSVLTVNMTATTVDGEVQTFEGMGYAPTHAQFIGAVLAVNPTRRADALQNLYAVDIATAATAFQVRTTLLANSGVVHLTTGTDGTAPGTEAYTAALATLERVSDVSIVAAPGHSVLTDAAGIRNAVISHVEKRGLYRIAVLDSAKGDNPAAVQATRGAIDSKKAALYYPWIVVPNPNARSGDALQPREILVPPSGAICGIYARNDIERGVSKTPANEVVRGALRFETDVSFGESELLNPLGINCLRFFPGRGYRVWGGRTVSSDPEWKYVSVRRFFNYLEASIERGTQWAVFESNGPALWANIRETISSFLYTEWRNGALLGETEKEAYFVRCDLSTMTQNDLDNGRLVCLVGVAVVKPAEFVVFRIGQKTASSRE